MPSTDRPCFPVARSVLPTPQADSTMLPYALHQIDCYSELLVLLWKALDENGTFLAHVLSSCDITAVSVSAVRHSRNRLA